MFTVLYIFSDVFDVPSAQGLTFKNRNSVGKNEMNEETVRTKKAAFHGMILFSPETIRNEEIETFLEKL